MVERGKKLIDLVGFGRQNVVNGNITEMGSRRPAFHDSSSNQPDALRQAPSHLWALGFFICSKACGQYNLQGSFSLCTCWDSTNTFLIDLSLSLSSLLPLRSPNKLLLWPSSWSPASFCPPPVQAPHYHITSSVVLKRKSNHSHHA